MILRYLDNEKDYNDIYSVRKGNDVFLYRIRYEFWSTENALGIIQYFNGEIVCTWRVTAKKLTL